MSTPQERRFVRLALARKALTREQMEACQQLQAQKQKEGTKAPLWDCAVLQNMLSQDDAEKLEDDAGDLTVDKLGEFTIVRKLGEGGMGAVYLGIGSDKNRSAIKIMAPHLSKQRPFLTRFFREGQASMKLQHQNLVRGYDIGEDAGYYFFALEFVDGKSLSQIIRDGGPLPPEKATEIILSVAEALAYAHENHVVHRDIKPENIMLTRDGVAKLMDLGLARQTDSEVTALTRTGTAMGTPYYMAPEQAQDAKRADERSDIYSLGASWYHMVTGKVPFEGATSYEVFQKHLKEPLRPPQALESKVPRAVSLSIERMMAKEPDRRFQSATEVCEHIREHCLGKRDIKKELGVGAEAKTEAKEDLWDMKVAVKGRVEKRRFSLAELRARIRKGQIGRETPAKRVGESGPYQPAGSYSELEREFPRDYAMAAAGQKDGDAPSSRSELRSLLTHYDESARSYHRKRGLKKLVPLLIKLGIAAVVALVIWLFWDSISGVLSGFMGD